MAHFKYINILTLFIATFAIIARCEAKNSDFKIGVNIAANSIGKFKQIPQDSLPKPIGYVNDFENIYTDKEEATLKNLMANFEKNTTIQIALVTIKTTMTTKENLDAFTLKIANNWGVGQKNKNNGITIGISKGHRKMRIQNGSGIQKILTDAETQKIVVNNFIPDFKKGNYFKGTLAGLTALMQTLQENLKEKK